MIKSLKDLKKACAENKSMKLAIAAAEDKDLLIAIKEASDSNIIEPILVGDREEIENIAKEINFDLSNIELIESSSLEESAKLSVKLVSDNKANFLMKGKTDTSILMKEVLDKKYGLRTDKLLSHVMVYEVDTYHKLLIFTDGGMNIAPNLDQKVQILENSLAVSRSLGNDNINVSVLTAKEKVSEKMQATVDADKIKSYCNEGKFGQDVYVEGPIAFDLAVSKKAAEIKGYESPVVGETDIVLVPNIEVGNGIGKSLTYLSNADSAGIIMGAKIPIVLVSRADSYEAKLNSIALGSIIASNN